MDISSFLLIITILIYAFSKTLETCFTELDTNKIKYGLDNNKEKYVVLNQYSDKNHILEATMRFTTIVSCVCATIFSWIAFSNSLIFQFSTVIENRNLSIALASGFLFLCLSVFMYIFGNLLAQKIGTSFAEDIVFATIKQVHFLAIILRPITFISSAVAYLIAKPFGVKAEEENVTQEEIRILMDAGEGHGVIDETEKEMINNIFEFNNTLVGDIGTHRTDIVAVPSTATLEDVIAVVEEEKFSRIPVYNENIDDIIGFFRTRDLLKFFIDKTHYKEFDLNKIILQPYFVPFSKKSAELFEEMQKNKVQMAIIIDEYGGTAGIVTMEDLIEEIVGNIFDEYDEDEDEIQEINENTYVVAGKTEIDLIEELFNVQLNVEDDYDTIGGFLIGQLGRIPDEQEHPEITIENLIFKIEKFEDKRIELIKIHKIA
ncbi:MAG: hemolysin family protein [Anaerotignaceae bacterium]